MAPTPQATEPAPPPVYRPRHPERTSTYRLLERHFDDYVFAHEERLEDRHGALRPVVKRSVAQYLDCGRLAGGFARIRCPSCRGEHLLAFSCRTRNLCPSCQAKRSALFAQRLRAEVVRPVAHRHAVFTVPKALRGLFERERALLGLLARAAYEALRRVMGAESGASGAVPGFVASIQTFGSCTNFHPHVHAVATEGVFPRDGVFLPLPWPPSGVLEEAFRRILLAALVRAERLSEGGHDALLSWRHSGFSVHAEQRIEAHDGARVEQLGRYATRPALASGAVSLRGDGRVEVKTPPDPRTGSESLLLDPLEFVHAVVTQIPDAGRHLVRYYGAYSHRFARAIGCHRLRDVDQAVRAVVIDRLHRDGGARERALEVANPDAQPPRGGRDGGRPVVRRERRGWCRSAGPDRGRHAHSGRRIGRPSQQVRPDADAQRKRDERVGEEFRSFHARRTRTSPVSATRRLSASRPVRSGPLTRGSSSGTPRVPDE